MKLQSILLLSLAGYVAAAPVDSSDEPDVGDQEFTVPANFTAANAISNAAGFVPPGRIRQDCSIGQDAIYLNSVALASHLQDTPGKNHVNKGQCKTVAHDNTKSVCIIMCAKGKDRVLHNHRLGAIVADVNVGCHSGASTTINGKDYFPEYDIEVHGC